MLGPHEAGLHGRRQLKALVALHGKHEGLGGRLSQDETKASGEGVVKMEQRRGVGFGWVHHTAPIRR